MSRLSSVWIAARALIYASVFLGAWAWLAYQAHLRDVPFGFALPSWLEPVGIALIVVGAALTVACVATFVVRGEGTPAPFDPPLVFVASGPYRWVRNPMYVGAFLLLAGYALWAGSFAALLVAFAMLGAAMLFVLVYEERSLERRFGESYRAYRRATPRWIPRRPRASADAR